MDKRVLAKLILVSLILMSCMVPKDVREKYSDLFSFFGYEFEDMELELDLDQSAEGMQGQNTGQETGESSGDLTGDGTGQGTGGEGGDLAGEDAVQDMGEGAEGADGAEDSEPLESNYEDGTGDGVDCNTGQGPHPIAPAYDITAVRTWYDEKTNELVFEITLSPVDSIPSGHMGGIVIYDPESPLYDCPEYFFNRAGNNSINWWVAGSTIDVFRAEVVGSEGWVELPSTAAEGSILGNIVVIRIPMNELRPGGLPITDNNLTFFGMTADANTNICDTAGVGQDQMAEFRLRFPIDF